MTDAAAGDKRTFRRHCRERPHLCLLFSHLCCLSCLCLSLPALCAQLLHTLISSLCLRHHLAILPSSCTLPSPSYPRLLLRRRLRAACTLLRIFSHGTSPLCASTFTCACLACPLPPPSPATRVARWLPPARCRRCCLRAALALRACCCPQHTPLHNNNAPAHRAAPPPCCPVSRRLHRLRLHTYTAHMPHRAYRHAARTTHRACSAPAPLPALCLPARRCAAFRAPPSALHLLLPLPPFLLPAWTIPFIIRASWRQHSYSMPFLPLRALPATTTCLAGLAPAFHFCPIFCLSPPRLSSPAPASPLPALPLVISIYLLPCRHCLLLPSYGLPPHAPHRYHRAACLPRARCLPLCPLLCTLPVFLLLPPAFLPLPPLYLPHTFAHTTPLHLHLPTHHTTHLHTPTTHCHHCHTHHHTLPHTATPPAHLSLTTYNARATAFFACRLQHYMCLPTSTRHLATP